MFFSTAVQEMVASLPKATHQVSDFAGMKVEEIVERFNKAQEVSLNLTKASEEEVTKLQEAADLSTTEASFFVNDEEKENEIMRAILDEVLECPQLFYSFLEFILEKGEELVVNEWNLYVVNHPEAGVATSYEETHHWKNFGLPKLEDPKREEVREMFRNVSASTAKRYWTILNSNMCEKHSEITEKTGILFANFGAMLSNTCRGGAFYGLAGILDEESYILRLLAWEHISTWK